MKKRTILFMTILTAVVLLTYSEAATKGVVLGLQSCANVVVPALFPFMILSTFLCLSDLAQYLMLPIRFLTQKILKLSDDEGLVFVMSFIGGYPVGAKLLSNLLSTGKTTPKTAERMLCYCVNAGPSFLIVGVGAGMFRSMSVGVVLLAAQIISALLIGIILSLRANSPPSNPKIENREISYAKSFVESVTGCCYSMLTLCGFIVLFSTVLTILKSSGALLWLAQSLSFFTKLDKDVIIVMFSGLIEVTTGCILSSNITGNGGLILCSIFISFSSLSIICQVISFFDLTQISIKPFLFSRVVSGLLTPLIALFLFRLFPPFIAQTLSSSSAPVTVVDTQNLVGTICLLCMCSIIVLSERKHFKK